MEENSRRERQGHIGAYGPAMGKPPGADRDPQFRSQIGKAEADRWRVQATSRWTGFCLTDGGGDRIEGNDENMQIF